MNIYNEFLDKYEKLKKCADKYEFEYQKLYDDYLVLLKRVNCQENKLGLQKTEMKNKCEIYRLKNYFYDYDKNNLDGMLRLMIDKYDFLKNQIEIIKKETKQLKKEIIILYESFIIMKQIQ